MRRNPKEVEEIDIKRSPSVTQTEPRFELISTFSVHSLLIHVLIKSFFSSHLIIAQTSSPDLRLENSDVFMPDISHEDIVC